MNEFVLLAGILGIPTIISVGFTKFINRKEEQKRLQSDINSANADTADKLVKTSQGLLDEFREERIVFKAEIVELQKQVVSLREETAQCHRDRMADQKLHREEQLLYRAKQQSTDLRISMLEQELRRYKAIEGET